MGWIAQYSYHMYFDFLEVVRSGIDCLLVGIGVGLELVLLVL